MEDIIRPENTWLWTRLTDEHLHVCLQDFTWLAKFGEESIRAGCAFTRDQISLERARRGRVRMSKRGSQWPVSQSLS